MSLFYVCPASCPECYKGIGGDCGGCRLSKGHSGPHKGGCSDLEWETTRCPAISPATGLQCKDLIPGHHALKHMSSVLDLWNVEPLTARARQRRAGR